MGLSGGGGRRYVVGATMSTLLLVWIATARIGSRAPRAVPGSARPTMGAGSGAGEDLHARHGDFRHRACAAARAISCRLSGLSAAARACPRRAGPVGSRGASTTGPHRHVGHTAECLLCAFDASSPLAAAAEWVWTWLGAPDGSCAFAPPPSRRGSSVVPTQPDEPRRTGGRVTGLPRSRAELRQIAACCVGAGVDS